MLQYLDNSLKYEKQMYNNVKDPVKNVLIKLKNGNKTNTTNVLKINN